MEHILRQQAGQVDDESVYSNDRFGAVYSHDNESVMSNGQFKAIYSEDDDDGYRERGAAPDEGRDSEDNLAAAGSNDDGSIHRCASGESAQYQGNVCTNLLIDTFKINPKELVVKIMAFAIPSQASIVEACSEQYPLPDFPGFICVGRVMTQTPGFCDIQLNDRVLVILPVEKNAQFETYANVPFNSVIKVAKDIDAKAQVSIILSYLPALQILQSLPYKVKNKKVILNGGVGPVIRALIQLCIIHGAKKIYVPCRKTHREDIRKIGGKTLGPRHSDWGPSYIEEIDIVIDAIGENNFVTSKAVLKEKGHLCVIGFTDSALKKKTMFNNLNKMILDYRVSQSENTTVFNFNESMNSDRESFIQDFEYLSKLISEGRIEPIFTGVSREEYQGVIGAKSMVQAPIICDPWTEYKWGE